MRQIILIKSALNHLGGLEKYTWQLAKDFCEQEISVTLLTTSIHSAPFTHPLLKLISFPIAHPLSVWQLLHFDKACQDYLAKHPCPIVFSLDRTRYQTHIRAGNGVHAAYLHRRSQIESRLKAVSFRLNPLHRSLLRIEKTAFEHPDLKILFTNSHMVHDEILTHYAVDPKKIEVIHNGVAWKERQHDFDLWQEKKPSALQKYGLNPEAFQFLFIGHNFRRKGLDLLLLALSLLQDHPFQLSVIGKDKHHERYRKKAIELGLEKKIFFFGPSQEILSFYQLADALIIPSLYDPFANVTLEALAMGLFVVSSRTNGGHEVLNKTSGQVVKEIQDPHSFAAALKIVLSHRKTPASALQIRSSVSHLDFSIQLRRMTQAVAFMN